ncbi:rhodanese-like domain-containing protein [Shewanella pealeana]|uniref:Rhodanese domain protein n=1 Tax=Shewanella pealeana (strain ATCC 700345 / ANG-SQ1) TaxID=398579 RepID=A8H9H7_SHEPA|nr:rhodanese-like domain-containing protein [Shewanella pealeana]ABV89214.1 Rhodanese domain protein [Shewanella pealeana ATCC 700345]
MLNTQISKLTTRPAGEQCWQLIQEGATVIDVRSPQEFAGGHLPQAINVPLDTLDTWLHKLENRQQVFVLYCGAGIRAQKGCDILMANGLESVINGGALKDLLSCQPKQ